MTKREVPIDKNIPTYLFKLPSVQTDRLYNSTNG